MDIWKAVPKEIIEEFHALQFEDSRSYVYKHQTSIALSRRGLPDEGLLRRVCRD